MADLIPPIAPNDRPPLHKIGEYIFQDLTVDLMAEESDLIQARLYGKRGQCQHGGDAVANCTAGGSVVAQCKCYEKVVPSDVKNACNDFYQNLDHWKTNHDARRFILVLACDADSAKVVDEIAKQRTRLRRKGIALETWDRIVIVQKLELNRRLVNRYLGSGLTWETLLCGPGAREDRASSISSSTSEAERLLLQGMLTEHAEHDLKRLREALRRGRRGEVRSELRSFRDNPTKWALLNAPVRAALLRLEAALELDSSADLYRAKALIEDARRLDSETSLIRLETRARLLEFGPVQALATIPTEDNLETLCARGSALLVLGDIDEAIRALEGALKRDVKDADVLRLLAIAHLVRGDLKMSFEFLAQVLVLAPDWEVVRHAKAVIYYVSALSSPDLQSPGSAFPDPLEWSFIRRDDESLKRLEEAEAIFAELLADTDRPRGDRQAIEIWRLACLANHINRQKQAAEYCAALIDQHPCNFFAIPWASARTFPIDFGRATGIALLEIDRGPSNLAAVLMATAGKLQTKDWTGASALLEKHRSTFHAQTQTGLWNYWWAIVLVFSGDPEGALDFIGSLEPSQQLVRIEIFALRVIAQRTRDLGPLVEKLSLLYGQTGNPNFLVELCNQYAIQGNWTAVAERSTELLEKVPTADSLYLALLADFNSHQYERCLGRTQEHRGFLAGGLLPLDMRRVRVGCLERLGKVAQALAEAEELRKDDASVDTLVGFIRLCMKFGSVPRAIAAGQDLVGRSDASQESRITVAELLVAYDPALSRELLLSVDAASISPEQIPTALSVGYRLDLEREMRTLFQRGIESTIEGRQVLRPVGQEEVLDQLRGEQANQNDLMQLYDRGQIPVHLLVDRFRVSLPALYWSHGQRSFSPLSQPQVMVRHGKRSDLTPPPKLSPSARLNLDITSVLLIHELDLWNLIKGAVSEVRFSGQVIPLLQETLLWTGSGQPGWQAGRREVVEMWQEGLIDTDTLGVDCTVAFLPSPTNAKEVNLRLVADQLRSRGVLSAADYEQALNALGAWGEATPLGRVPEGARRIQCNGSIGVLLAIAGLLRPLASAFTVTVDRGLVASLREAVRDESENAGLGERIKQLIEFLSRELQGERLKLIPDSGADKDFDKLGARCVAESSDFPLKVAALV